MKNGFLSLTTILIGCAALSGLQARADLLVEQWQTPTGVFGGIAGVETAIAGGPADISELWSIIDFTDDPAGFAGDIPGSVAWPAATAAGVSGTGNPVNDFFGARISGLINITAADTYTFKTYADDGVRLRVGGTTVITDNTYHPEQTRFGSIALTPGSYAIELLFFEGGGEASLEFQVQQGTGPFGHVGGVGGPTTVPTVPDGGSTLALLGVGAALLGVARRKTSAGK
jgi:hypothetical protein